MNENPYKSPDVEDGAQDASDDRATTGQIWHVVAWAIVLLPILVMAAIAVFSTL